MKRNCLLVLVACMFCNVIWSQATFKNGLTVLNSGDTLRGFIDYRQWEKNPRAIRFRTSMEAGEAMTLTIKDITYFEIVGLDHYLRAVVQKDLRPVDMNELLSGSVINDTTVTDTVFLRTLVDAKLSLFALIEDKPHYYIRDDKGAFQELLYKVHMVDANSSLSRTFIFRDQLNQLIESSRRTPSLLRQLRQTEYRENDLVKIVERMNEGIVTPLAYKATKNRQPISFFIGAGAVLSRMNVSGNQQKLKNLKYSSGFSPMFTAGFDIGGARNLERFLFRFELAWYAMDTEGSNYSKDPLIDYRLKSNNIMPSLSILFKALNESKHKLYLGTGVGLNFSSYPGNTLIVTDKYAIPEYKETEDYIDYEKKWISVFARAGYIFNNKMEIATTIKYAGAFSDYSFWSVSASVNTLALIYRF